MLTVQRRLKYVQLMHDIIKSGLLHNTKKKHSETHISPLYTRWFQNESFIIFKIPRANKCVTH